MIKIVLILFGMFICIGGQYPPCLSKITTLSPNCKVQLMMSTEFCLLFNKDFGDLFIPMVTSSSQSYVKVVGVYDDDSESTLYSGPVIEGKWILLEVNTANWRTSITLNGHIFNSNDEFIKVIIIVKGQLYFLSDDLLPACQTELLGYIFPNGTKVSTTPEGYALFGQISWAWRISVICAFMLFLIIIATLATYIIKLQKDFKEAKINIQANKSETISLRNQLMKKIPRVPSICKDTQYYDLDEKPLKTKEIHQGYENAIGPEKIETVDYDGFENVAFHI